MKCACGGKFKHGENKHLNFYHATCSKCGVSALHSTRDGLKAKLKKLTHPTPQAPKSEEGR